MHDDEQESDADVFVALVYALLFGIYCLLFAKVCFVLPGYISYWYMSDRRLLLCFKEMEDRYMILAGKRQGKMESEEKAASLEYENNKSMIEEELKKYQEEDTRTTKKVFRLFSVIWEAIVFFFS